MFLEHGKEHDAFMTPWETIILLPCHRGVLR